MDAWDNFRKLADTHPLKALRDEDQEPLESPDFGIASAADMEILERGVKDGKFINPHTPEAMVAGRPTAEPNWVQEEPPGGRPPGVEYTGEEVPPSVALQPGYPQAPEVPPAAPEAPSATQVVERATGQKSTRMGGAWRNLPEDLRPEQLAGGLTIYPFERREYEARIQQAVQDGTVSPKVAKQVMAGYDKWKRTSWGAMVDYSRLQREEKHIGMEADADERIIEERQARQDEEAYAWLDKNQAESQQAYEDERATYQESLAQTMAQQEAAIENLARREIDPERWWNSKSNGQKAMSAIGVALGSLGSGLTGIYGRGTPNTAYDMMKSAINRDVTAQMADMRNKRASVGARQSLMGTIMSQVKDAATAQTITKMALLDQAKSKINMYSAVATGDKARRNAEELITLVDNDREILAAELRMNAHKLAAARAARVKARVKAPTAAPPLITKYMENNYSPRLGGVLRGGTPGMREKLMEGLADISGDRVTLNKLRTVMSSPGYMTSPSKQMHAKELYESVQIEKRKLAHGANYTVIEKELGKTGMMNENAATAIFGSLEAAVRGGKTPLDSYLDRQEDQWGQRARDVVIQRGREIQGSEIATGRVMFKGKPHVATRWVAADGPPISIADHIRMTRSGDIEQVDPRLYREAAPVPNTLVPEEHLPTRRTP